MVYNMVEMIVFVNRKGVKFIIDSSDNNYYEFDEFEFCVRDNNTSIDESLLEVDGWGISDRLDVDKAFKPLKFYRVKWWEEDLNTPDGHSYSDIIEELEEIDYIGESK